MKRLLWVLTVGLWLATALAAQPDETRYENLQLLPADISRDSLQAVMSTYSSALGVRCSFCHVRKRGKRDFASDDKHAKTVARSMMRLTDEINATLRAEGGGAVRRIECVTCHHGATSPRTLQAELRRELNRGGIDAAIEHYEQLRAEFYGRSTYDFGENSLLDLAGNLAQAGDEYNAIEFLRLNLTYFPDSVFTLSQLAGALHRIGAPQESHMRLQEALQLAPDNRHVRAQLEELFGGQPPD